MTHVVMVVANDISNDSRVRKEEAAALAQGGLRVTVLGVSRDRESSLDGLDDVVTLHTP